ncbi:hypothetical protein BC835DRAFT_1424032 [Cytidiella melzeri]|nr:hypothetical protein BC835DRAFT_1424032 [Cytidiella melzeri]
MQFSISLILFVSIATGAFHMVTVFAAPPYGNTETHFPIPSENINTHLEGRSGIFRLFRPSTGRTTPSSLYSESTHSSTGTVYGSTTTLTGGTDYGSTTTLRDGSTVHWSTDELSPSVRPNPTGSEMPVISRELQELAQKDGLVKSLIDWKPETSSNKEEITIMALTYRRKINQLKVSPDLKKELEALLKYKAPNVDLTGASTPRPTYPLTEGSNRVPTVPPQLIAFARSEELARELVEWNPLTMTWAKNQKMMTKLEDYATKRFGSNWGPNLNLGVPALYHYKVALSLKHRNGD